MHGRYACCVDFAAIIEVMSYHNPIPRRVAVAAHPHLPEAAQECPRVAEYFATHGVEVLHDSFYSETIRHAIEAQQVEMLVVLGGDGSMLRAGRMCAPAGIPVLGINLGRFGFLIEVERERWRETLPLLLQGNYWLENRMVLHAEHWRKGQCIAGWNVLNEVVVCRGALVRPIHVHASVDGDFLTTYVADGLIAATPTGSTAYALAAGGPILPPQVRNIIIVPVAPHLSVNRAIVLAEGASVQIGISSSHGAVISVDGQAPVSMEEGDTVSVSAAQHTVQFVRFQDPGYFFRKLISHMEQNPSTRNNV